MNMKIGVPTLFLLLFFFQTIIHSSKIDSIFVKPYSENPPFLQTPDNASMMESKIENSHTCSKFYMETGFFHTTNTSISIKTFFNLSKQDNVSRIHTSLFKFRKIE